MAAKLAATPAAPEANDRGTPIGGTLEGVDGGRPRSGQSTGGGGSTGTSKSYATAGGVLAGLARSMQRMVASRSISGGSFGQLDPGGRRRTEQSSTAFGDLDSAGRVPSGNRSCPLTLVDEAAGVRQT